MQALQGRATAPELNLDLNPLLEMQVEEISSSKHLWWNQAYIVTQNINK